MVQEASLPWAFHGPVVPASVSGGGSAGMYGVHWETSSAAAVV